MFPIISKVLSLILVGWISNSAIAGVEIDLAGIEMRYEIDIVSDCSEFPVLTRHGAIEGKDASLKELEAYGNTFLREFPIYPVALVKRTRLRRIVFCRELAFAGQRRNAVPDFEHDTLYLDVSRGSHSKGYQRKVIHHEFFHLIDYRDDGKLYEDSAWSALNPPIFEYGDGGRNAQNRNETSLLTNKFPGFLNHYSTTGVEEDKAEIFANMIVDFEAVDARARSDEVIEAKRRAMKELLIRFSPQADESLWQNVRETKRSGD